MTAAIIVAVVVVVLGGLLVVTRRRPKLDGGLDSWRRHIDALSPESRREVIERVRGAEERRRNGNGNGDAGGEGES